MNLRYLSYCSRQRGFSLIAMGALLLLLSAGMIVGYMSRNAEGRLAYARNQGVVLDRAQGLLESFIFLHGRLPCPASQREGVEDCSVAGKGWFPIGSLMTMPSGINAPILQAVSGIRYVAYRGDGTVAQDPDLTGTSRAYSPQGPAGTTLSGFSSSFSGLDFCAKLQALGVAPGATPANRWQVNDVISLPLNTDRAYVDGNPPSNVAYALVVAGGHSGFGGLGFSGLDADNSDGMESASKSHSAIYGDRVRAVDPGSLSRAFECPALMASTDVLDMAAEWTADANGEKTGNMKTADFFANQYLPRVIVQDTLFATGRLTKTLVAIGKIEDATFLWSLDILLLNFADIPNQIAALNDYEIPIAASAGDFLALATVATNDVEYQQQYADGLNKATAAVIWGGAVDILEEAVGLGFSPLPVLNNQ